VGWTVNRAQRGLADPGPAYDPRGTSQTCRLAGGATTLSLPHPWSPISEASSPKMKLPAERTRGRQRRRQRQSNPPPSRRRSSLCFTSSRRKEDAWASASRAERGRHILPRSLRLASAGTTPSVAVVDTTLNCTSADLNVTSEIRRRLEGPESWLERESIFRRQATRMLAASHRLRLATYRGGNVRGRLQTGGSWPV